MRPALQGPALLLKAADRGEDDRLLTLLTPEHGRVPALARHARGSKRRRVDAVAPGGTTTMTSPRRSPP